MGNNWRWNHKNFFLKIAIEESILNIHLRYIPLTDSCNSNKGTNIAPFYNGSKSLLVICNTPIPHWKNMGFLYELINKPTTTTGYQYIPWIFWVGLL